MSAPPPVPAVASGGLIVGTGAALLAVAIAVLGAELRRRPGPGSASGPEWEAESGPESESGAGSESEAERWGAALELARGADEASAVREASAWAAVERAATRAGRPAVSTGAAGIGSSAVWGGPAGVSPARWAVSSDGTSGGSAGSASAPVPEVARVVASADAAGAAGAAGLAGSVGSVGSVGSTLAGTARAALGHWSAPARVLVGFGVCAVVAVLMGVVREDVALLGVALAGALFAARRGSVARVAAIAQARRAAAASGAVDLLGAALMAGLNGHLALLRIAERVPLELADEFRLVAADLRLGRTPAVALRGAAERTGLAELRAAAGALHAAERWGAPAAEALAARSEALRTRLRLEAEAGAGRAAVKLAFPLVICFLPAFVLLTVVPLVAGALRAAGF